MQDLTKYSADELSNYVFNDEGLYNLRHTGELRSALDERFTYTLEQLKILCYDLEEDKEEQDA